MPGSCSYCQDSFATLKFGVGAGSMDPMTLEHDRVAAPAGPGPAPDGVGRPGAAVVHPRPQLVRESWVALDGSWGFASDDSDQGRDAGWHDLAGPFGREITVPYPPESSASGIGEPGFHPVVWYRRAVTRSDLLAAGLGSQGGRVLLHFGAVDYVADVWLAGHYLGRHEGGSTPFSFDITRVVSTSAHSWPLVVRAQDDPHDVAQPRGKQDWEIEPHGIWYPRTTGIWQPVWLEAIPRTAVTHVAWAPNLPDGSVQMSLELNNRPRSRATVSVTVQFEGRFLARVQFSQDEPRGSVVINLPPQANGQAYESMLWSPENPRLITATIRVATLDGAFDEVTSYFGLRSVGWSGGHFLLNDRPYYLRAVLAQGYWPETHLAAPDGEALRQEVQLIKDLGFNAVRVHQKMEDPRFLAWCDRLGVLVWAEAASSYEFSSTAVERMTREWTEIIRRDISHPSIMTWVPLNESWGVQHIAHDSRQLDYARMLYHLTRSLDPSRPVITNDGWEHADSDMWTIHDYGESGAEVAANYVDREAVAALLAGIGPLGRRMKLLNLPDRGQPVIVSEFGGVSYAPTHDGPAWGYVTASEAAHFQDLLSELFRAVQGSPVLAGFCYTQLTDTYQEANGLTDPRRQPKLPVETIRSIVLGHAVDVTSHRRPKVPLERVSPPRPAD